jgi:F-type H+-transporting ATPase subunit a
MEGAETATHDIATAGAEAAHQGGIHVALAAEKVGSLWGLPITNTLVMSWTVMLLFVVVAFFVRRNLAMIPGRLQTALELVFGFAYDYIADVLGSRDLARRFFPLLVTTFLFIWIANALEFTPGIGSITVTHEGETAPLLRSVNTDLNMTLALTLIAVLVIEVSGMVSVGVLRYWRKFFNLGGVHTVVGLIEFIGEVARVISFSFRLFGNIFAGEVLIAVVAFFVPYILPVPLMAFEMFVGVVQAAIFTLLMLFFIKMAITDPHAEEHAEHAPAH